MERVGQPIDVFSARVLLETKLAEMLKSKLVERIGQPIDGFSALVQLEIKPAKMLESKSTERLDSRLNDREFPVKIPAVCEGLKSSLYV